MTPDSQFLTGRPLAPDYVITAQRDADYLLSEVAHLKARNAYLQAQADTHRDELEAAVVERDEARESLTPWKLAAALGWVIVLVRWVVR